MKKAPIELDALLCRYLNDIEFLYDKNHAPNTKWDDGRLKRNQILVDRFLDGETYGIDHDTDSRFKTFQKYFEKAKSLRFLPYEKYWFEYLKKDDDAPLDFYELKNPYKEVVYEKKIYVEVKDIKFIRGFRKKYAAAFEVRNKVLEKFGDDDGRTLYMNRAGDFFYGSSRKDISVRMRTDKDYYKILVGIYHATNTSGSASVSEINEAIRKHFGHKTTYTKKQMQNAINQSLIGKRHLPKSLPGGAKMFSWTKDILTFNNPLLKQDTHESAYAQLVD